MIFAVELSFVVWIPETRSFKAALLLLKLQSQLVVLIYLRKTHLIVQDASHVFFAQKFLQLICMLFVWDFHEYFSRNVLQLLLVNVNEAIILDISQDMIQSSVSSLWGTYSHSRKLQVRDGVGCDRC